MTDFTPKTGSIGKPAPIQGESKKNSPSSKAGGVFDQLLTKKLQESSASEQSDFSSGLSEIQSPVKPAFTTPASDTFQVTEKLNTSLELLETYAAFLADPDKTLKQASELLEQLLNQSRTLEQEFLASNSTDPDLKQILTHLTTTAAIEKIKLDRGDYSS